MEKKKVCWKITTRCNQKCNYCFGFVDIQELSYSDNKRVMDNLKANGLTDITWTGGEAVLYPQLNELIKYAREKEIKNKLVTNGIYLSQNNNEYVDDILNNLDEIDLSIDSISNEVNIELGKENNHYYIIKNLLDKIKNKELRVCINTVVSKINIDGLNELGEFLNGYMIDKWKFLKFMPIREKSLVNKEKFDIDEKILKNSLKRLKKFGNISNIVYKAQNEFEKSLVVLPNGDLIQTQNGKDFKLGNALLQDRLNLEGVKVMNKIRTLIAHNDENIANKIKNSINKLNCVEVVCTTNKGRETYDKILDLKPEMVFAKYDLEGMNGLEIMKLSKEKLENETPIFNILVDENNESFVHEAVQLGTLNALIREPNEERFIDIITDYNEYKNK